MYWWAWAKWGILLAAIVTFSVIVGFAEPQNPSPTAQASATHFIELPKDKISFNADHVKVFSESALKGVTTVTFIDGSIANYPIEYSELKKRLKELGTR